MQTRHMPLLLALVLVVTLGLGCAAKQAARMAEAPPTAASPPPATEADALSGGAADKQAAPGAAPQASEPAQASATANRKIITSGEMNIEVKDLDAAVTELTRLVQQSGGFFANKSINAQEDWRRAELTIRVPAAGFQKLHDGARSLGTVKQDNQTGEDVTKQWQDLEARIKIRQAEEQSLVRLMQQQGRLADLLEIEKRLWEVREQIEQAQGDLRVLRDKVTLATLTISLSEQIPVGAVKVGPWNLGYHVATAWHSLVRAIKAIIIAVIYVLLPGAVVWVPVVALIWWLRRRARARRPQPPPPPGTG